MTSIPGTAKPTVDFVRSWFQREYDRWKSRRHLDEKVRSRLFREYTPDASGPDGEENELTQVTVRSGIARTLLREFTGIMSADDPHIEALADGLGPKANDKASDIEDWDGSWFADVAGDDVVQLIDADQLAYGRGISFVGVARQFWDTMPHRGDGQPSSEYNRAVKAWREEHPQPITWQHCPAPQTLFSSDIYDRYYGPPGACFWEYRRASDLAASYPASQVARAYQRDQEPKEQDPWYLFLCWSNRQFSVYAVRDGVASDDEAGVYYLQPDCQWEFVQEPFEHGLPHNPFVIQFGDLTGDPDLAHRHAGIFDNSLDTIDQLDATLSQYATQVSRYARGQPMLRHTPVNVGGQFVIYGVDDETQEPRTIEFNPNEVISLLPGEEFDWVVPPMEQFRAAIELHNLLSLYIQRDTLAPSSWGGGASTESGFQLITLIQASERKLKPLIRRKAAALKATLEHAHTLVSYLGAPITVARATGEDDEPLGGLVTLAPKDAKKARVRVSLSPKLDSAEAANMQLGLQIAQVMASGAIDLDPAWVLKRFFGQENPERHADAARLARFLKNPELEGWVTQYALKKAEMLLQKEDVAQVQALAALSPAELLLAPGAVRGELAARGLAAPQDAGVASLLSGAAPGASASLGAGAPMTNPATQYTGGRPGGPGGVAANQLSQLLSAMRSGQPRSPADAAAGVPGR